MPTRPLLHVVEPVIVVVGSSSVVVAPVEVSVVEETYQQIHTYDMLIWGGSDGVRVVTSHDGK